MKKFLSIVSLLLVAMMILSMPVVSAEEVTGEATTDTTGEATTDTTGEATTDTTGEETTDTTGEVTDETTEEEGPFELPKDIQKYYANDITGKTPTIDGIIEEGEYGKLTVRVDDPSPMVSDTGVFMTEPADDTLRSEYIDFWFAYDENNIYLAMHIPSPQYKDNGDEFKKNDVTYRYNSIFKMGFDLEDLTGGRFRFGGSATHVHWNDLRYFEFGAAKVAPVKTNSFITEAVIRKVNATTGEDIAVGDLSSTSGNVNFADGPWEQFIEFKMDKKAIANTMNECFFTKYDTTPNAMYFAFSTQAYRAQGSYKDDGTTESLSPNDTQYWTWLGNTNITDKQGEYTDFGLYEGGKYNELMDVIIFGDENTVVEPADPWAAEVEEPEPLDTEPVIEDTENNDQTDAPATEAPTTEAPTSDGGCGGAVSLAGIALVAALGTCTVFVAKKKED